jgi:hypothetical protein
VNGEYLPGIYPPAVEPLGRFLPPIPDGAAAAWFTSRLPVGSWVLDPFGTSPRLVVEIARLGYRVLVAANNPVIRFLLELAAKPPPKQELQTSLAELASAYRGNERIEPHLRSLYQTECAHCGASIMAEAFLWEHAEGGKTTTSAPYARIYTCPVCRDSGEHPCNPADIARAAQFSANSLHHARALERVVPRNDPDRPYAEQAINVYLPRAVYALFTLINKLDGLDISPERRRHLAALLLHSCDQANTMWKYPVERERRYQLVIPPHFREQNIWLAMEQGLDLWSAEGNPGKSQPIPLYTWPALHPTDQDTAESGIWIFEGRVKSLAESLSGLKVKAVCTALPRPNQAFWTLSALWAGWLWGPEAVGPFRSVLRRQRYDWGWHTTALVDSLSNLGNVLEPETPFLGLMGEFEPNYLAAALVAADLTGFEIQNLAIRPEIGQAQITWSRERGFHSSIKPNLEKIAIQEATRYLEDRSEPASFAHAFSASLLGAVKARYFHIPNRNPKLDDEQATTDRDPNDDYTQAVNTCKDVLTYRSGFLRYGPLSKSRSDLNQSLLVEADPTIPREEREPGLISLTNEERAFSSDKDKHPGEFTETGLVWLRDASRATPPPLADRIELALVNYLIKHPGCSTLELDQAMCTIFPGLFTPDSDFIQICLDSYAKQESPPIDGLSLRAQDSPLARRKDLDEAQTLIARLGNRFDFVTQARQPSNTHELPGNRDVYCWVDRFEQPQYWLFPIASAMIGEIILQNQMSPGKGLIIMPGGRANLVAYKLRRDPRLSRLCDASQGGWRFLKFRHLRWLEANPLLNCDNLDEQFALDPLTYSTPQLRLL